MGIEIQNQCLNINCSNKVHYTITNLFAEISLAIVITVDFNVKRKRKDTIALKLYYEVFSSTLNCPCLCYAIPSLNSRLVDHSSQITKGLENNESLYLK